VYIVYILYIVSLPYAPELHPGTIKLTSENRVRFEFNYVDDGGQISNHLPQKGKAIFFYGGSFGLIIISINKTDKKSSEPDVMPILSYSALSSIF